MNRNRTPQSTIVFLDNADVAASVIKTLRSSSNSSRAYKQNAMNGEFLIQNVQALNRVIEQNAVEVNKIKVHERQLNESMAIFKPNVSPSIGNTHIPSPGAKSESFRQGCAKSGDDKGDDDDDDEYMGLSSDDDKDQSPKRNPQQHPMYPPSRAHAAVSAIKRTTSDEDLMNEIDDDEDNNALFANFVAPSSGDVSVNPKVLGKGLKASSAQGGISSGSTKYTKRSSVSGRGGIRGIQELLSSSTIEDSSQLSGSCSSPNLRTSSAGGAGTTNGHAKKASLVPHSSQQAARVASLVANAKPGQPIRIRAHGK